MFELKRISPDAVPAAIEKAEHYRALNQPGQAESICRDVIEIEPDSQRMLITLVLALADQFPRGTAGRLKEAQELVSRLESEYDRSYYTGILFERQAKAHHRSGVAGCGYATYDLLRVAMDWYERAEALRSPKNDDSLLRWNACVRLIEEHANIEPEPEPEPGRDPPLMLE
jgi:hypothetical protein